MHLVTVAVVQRPSRPRGGCICKPATVMLVLHQSCAQGAMEFVTAPAAATLIISQRAQHVKNTRGNASLARGPRVFALSGYNGGYYDTPHYMVVGQQKCRFCSTLHKKSMLYFQYRIINYASCIFYYFYLTFWVIDLVCL